MAADKSGKPRSLPLDQAGSQAGIARIVRAAGFDLRTFSKIQELLETQQRRTLHQRLAQPGNRRRQTVAAGAAAGNRAQRIDRRMIAKRALKSHQPDIQSPDPIMSLQPALANQREM